jgi:hypothetical protein
MHSGPQGCQSKGGRGRGECGGSVSGVTESRAVAGRLADGGEGSSGENSDAGSLGAWNWGKEERGRSGERRDVGAPFYRVGGGRGGLVTEGNERRWWCAIMVV